MKSPYWHFTFIALSSNWSIIVLCSFINLTDTNNVYTITSILDTVDYLDCTSPKWWTILLSFVKAAKSTRNKNLPLFMLE